MFWKRQIPIFIVTLIGSITLFGWFIDQPNVKEFVVSVLHEIDHAKMRYKMGPKKYEHEYTMAGQDAVEKGGDFHDDNFYEEQAEKWAQNEYRRKWKRKFKGFEKFRLYLFI